VRIHQVAIGVTTQYSHFKVIGRFGKPGNVGQDVHGVTAPVLVENEEMESMLDCFHSVNSLGVQYRAPVNRIPELGIILGPGKEVRERRSLVKSFAER
jgi:hypothetical protein